VIFSLALDLLAGLPELEFRQTGGQFVQTIWRPKIGPTPQVTPQVRGESKPLSEKQLRELAAVLARLSQLGESFVYFQAPERGKANDERV
jgi:hypothetical protein